MSNKEERLEELMKLREPTKRVKSKMEEKVESIEFPSTWRVSEKGLKGIQRQVKDRYSTHGILASVPMLCRGEECPYAEICPLFAEGEDVPGERCPLEIGLIITKFEEYKEAFGITNEDYIDMGLTRDLIDCDIQLFRIDNKMALQGDFLEEVVVGVTPKGQVIKNKELSKATEYKDRILNKRFKILELMNSTRKDKSGDKMTISLDPSTYASQLMSQLASKNEKVIDAEFEEDNE